MAARKKTQSKEKERVFILVNTGAGHEEVEVADHIAQHIGGTCHHGVTECRTCRTDHRSDKLLVGLVAGGIGLILGAAAAQAEPQRETRYIILDD